MISTRVRRYQYILKDVIKKYSKYIYVFKYSIASWRISLTC